MRDLALGPVERKYANYLDQERRRRGYNIVPPTTIEAHGVNGDFPRGVAGALMHDAGLDSPKGVSYLEYLNVQYHEPPIAL